jgi:hypothetical protein
VTEFSYSQRAKMANPDGTPEARFFSALAQAFLKSVPFAQPSDQAFPVYTLATVPAVNVAPLIIVSDGAAGQKLRAWDGAAYVA